MIDMKNLEKKIEALFQYFSISQKNTMNMTSDQRKRFISSINRRISLSAAAGSLIQLKEKQLVEINRIQDNYLSFIGNYPQAYIVGGAGTGKTYIGIKKAKMVLNENPQAKILITCVSEKLASKIKKELNEIKIDCRPLSEVFALLLKEEVTTEEIIGDSEKIASKLINRNEAIYDCIIIDEAQDIDSNIALALRSLLRDQLKSVLYVFYDEHQNIFSQEYADGFLLDYPIFKLTENIRNTSAIITYAFKNTKIVPNMTPNPVEGTEPDVRNVKNIREFQRTIENILNLLINKEKVLEKDIVILTDKNNEESILARTNFLENYNFNKLDSNTDIQSISVSDFKGMESNVVIYIKELNESTIDYIAFTRAKYYLYIINVSGRG